MNLTVSPPKLQTWYSWLTLGQYLILSSHLIGKHKNTYLKNVGGAALWLSDKESACQYRRHRFNL